MKTSTALLAVGVAIATAQFTVRAGDLGFSDPANVAPPPEHAIGFPSRDANLDALPGFQKPPPGYGVVPEEA